MFIAIYEFVVRHGQDTTFVKNWEIVTEEVFNSRGSLGSRLHMEVEGKYVAYAQWPNEETFEKEIPLPAEALKASELMKSSCISMKLAHRLTVVADLLKSP
jgi:quinol monooxygenase YgiN